MSRFANDYNDAIPRIVTLPADSTGINELVKQAMEFLKEERMAEAAGAIAEAIRRDPMNPELWFHAGSIAISRGETEFARAMFENCTHAIPGNSVAWYNLAYCLYRQGNYAKAESAYRQSIALAPKYSKAYVALGQMLFLLGRPDEGDALFTHFLSMSRGTNWRDIELRGLVRAGRGEFESAWQEFEEAWSRRIADGPHSERQLWDGHPKPDRDLVLAEWGGAGDAILFARYIPFAAALVRRVYFVAPRTVHRLLTPISGLSGVVAQIGDAPADALVGSQLLLPLMAGCSPRTIPSSGGYLEAPTSGPMLDQTSGLRVGLCWYGNPAFTHDRDRSAPSLARLAPLFAVPGVDWFSLQLGGARTAAEATLPVRPCPPVADFADTAFLIRQLDLVISVDTAVANLAGAMGHPTWVIVPPVPELRWLHGGITTPWYSTARLYQRPHTDAWEEMALRIAADLSSLIRQRGESSRGVSDPTRSS